MTTLTVTAKGQVTFRQELLRYLGVQPGQQIELSTLPGGSIEVRAAQTGSAPSSGVTQEVLGPFLEGE
jgi:bifunctional DNA-binding transcriptional regulator/antitoxin component of YhaV-PrlF toxin-antitoxin module